MFMVLAGGERYGQGVNRVVEAGQPLEAENLTNHLANHLFVGGAIASNCNFDFSRGELDDH